MLNGWIKKQINSLFFEPAWQQGDHFAVVGHLTSILNVADAMIEVNIPKDVNAVLAQAVDKNINYTISGTNPTVSSGFVLIAGNDPLAIPVGLHTKLKFFAAEDGARLELQFGVL